MNDPAMVAAEKICQYVSECRATNTSGDINDISEVIRNAYAGRTEAMAQALFEFAHEFGQSEFDSMSPEEWIRTTLALYAAAGVNMTPEVQMSREEFDAVLEAKDAEIAEWKRIHQAREEQAVVDRTNIHYLTTERDRLAAEVERLMTVNDGYASAFDTQNARIVELEQQVEALQTWNGLMQTLDKFWPTDIVPTLPDDPSRDTGSRIVSLLRIVDELRQDAARKEQP